MNAATKYAKRDGVHLAYQVRGDGPDLLVVPDGYVTAEAMAELPASARLLDRLATFSRVVCFDRRGFGLSDPIDPGLPPTLEQWAGDALAVLEAVGSAETCLLGLAEGAFVATMLAASAPDRVRALVLVHPTPGSAHPWEHNAGTIVEAHRRLAERIDEVWEGDIDDAIEAFAPSLVGDEIYREWLARTNQRSMSPATARSTFDVLYHNDMTAVLPHVRVPTLVVHRAGNRYVTPEYGRAVAASIPGATFTEVPGEDHVIYAGDPEPILGEIEEFVTGTRTGPTAARVLATLLFTDIADSTARAARIGDRRWREVLDAHDAMVRRQLGRFGGHHVRSTGDGVLATFDGPARAIECARAVRAAARQLDLEVRAGLHTGEIDLRGTNIGGIAVHLAARVAAAAAPGEILVSRTVTDLVAGSGIEFTDRGTHELKGLTQPWQLYAVSG
jgi:class 3 adenylate cyclase